MLRFRCPKCRTPLRALEENAGRKTQCLTCGGVVMVPVAAPHPPAVIEVVPTDAPAAGPPPTVSVARTDRVYYRNGGIKVTTTRAVFGSKSYAVNGITSTNAVEIPPNRVGPILLLVTGLLWVGCGGLATLGAFAMSDNAWPFASVTVINTAMGVVVAGLAGVWLLLQKTRYAVVLCTAACEQQAYVTTDSGEVDAIANAIDKAITDRG
jgi:hypothetical protein